MNYQGFSIQKVDKSDIPIIRELAYEIWPECFKGIIPDPQIGPMLDSIYASEELGDDMDNKGHVYWIASIGDEHCGYMSAYTEGTVLWIKKIYLHARCRGRGAGRALLKTAMEYFSDATCLSLYVNCDNKAAQGFYERQGFIVSQEVPVKMGPYDFIDLIMTKVIER